MNKAIIKYNELVSSFAGDIETSEKILTDYSYDASLFEIKPALVVFPKNSADICTLVKFVNEHKDAYAELSLTSRGGGTDMSGGAINDSIIVAFERYFNHIGPLVGSHMTVQLGVYYRDFEIKTLQNKMLLPSYPASRELCMIGGMVANNAGGEKSLIYGKTDRYVKAVKMVLSDGVEHTFKPQSGAQLVKKLAETGVEGDIYRKVYSLVTENAQLIDKSKPKVSKNSTGYNVWGVWDGQTFDLTKLIVGSQGTLGIITEVTFQLIPAKPLSGMVVVLMPSLKGLGHVINSLLPLHPVA